MSGDVGLLGWCAQAVSSLEGQDGDPEQFLESFLASCPVTSDAERAFISEVFAGCVTYQRLIQVVIRAYYRQASCLRSDSALYNVISYLVLFRLEELGVAQFKRLAHSQRTHKVHKFLSFLFAGQNLEGWLKDEWCKLYDESFIQATLLEPLARHTPAMLDYIATLAQRLDGQTAPKARSQPVTQTQPFNLTAPTVRLHPTPQLVPSLQPHKPVPQTTYSRPAEEGRLARAFQANKARAEGVLLQAEQLRPSCAEVVGPSTKTRQRMEQLLAEREAELKLSPVKAGSVPQSMRESRPVRLNAVAILREGARVQKEEGEETKRLAGLEAGQRDGSEYTKWQEEIKQKEAAEQQAELKRKHLEGQLSYEEAIIAKEQHARETRDKVVLSKKEREAVMKQYLAERQEEQREMRQLVEQTMSGHQQTKEAKQKLLALKKRMVQEAAQERKELVARALEEAEEEWRRKLELIRQIRAMESVPVLRVKHVDLTETSGQGLLTEMSVAELRERLALMKLAESQEKERKRTEISQKKKAKADMLSETMENISKHRAQLSRQTSAREVEQKALFKKHQTELHEKKLSSLQDKLEAKRRERVELKQVPVTKPAQSASKQQESATPISTLLRTTNTAVH